MNSRPNPEQTAVARQWLAARDTRLDRIQQALLATLDGHRSIVELESVARAMGLAPATFEHLRRQGLIDFASEVPGTAGRVFAGDH